MDIRPQAVAGTFYPADPHGLRGVVDALLAGAIAPLQEGVAPSWPKAIVVPHAGYIYSGATAAQAFAQLAPGRGLIRRVVLLGPVHRVAIQGLAMPGAVGFSTPLGVVPMDRDGIGQIARRAQMVVSPRAHAQEHSLEVQLPFLQAVLGEFALVPLAVGDCSPAEVADILETLWGGPETVIVISSDLSHYLPYATAQQVDRETVAAILAGQPTLNHRQACGATPVNGLLIAAGRHHLRPRLLELCNSGDTAGDRDRVVGYASFAFDATQQQPHDPIPELADEVLLPIARAAIAQALGRADRAPEAAAWLQGQGATFVTLTLEGRLRGCIGSLHAHRPLLADLKANAVAAALRDPRFPPLTAAELDKVDVEISLLSEPQPMPVADEADALKLLRPGIDGLIFNSAGRRSTFLPQVWAQLPGPAEFLAHLKQKAGLPPGYWSDDVQLQRYTVRKWTEAKLRHRQAQAAAGPLQ